MKLKIDFFRLVMPLTTKSKFEDILYSINQSPNDSGRNVEVRSTPIRLRRAAHRGDLWEADLTRIRMDSLPVKASLAGGIENLDFEADEGVGEETAFLYRPDNQVLVMQRNRYGVSASALAFYFHGMGKLQEPIILEPILRQDAIDILERMHIIRKFSIRLAEVYKPESLRQSGKSLNSVIDLLNQTQAPRAEISVSMGRQPGSLSVQNIVRMAKDLFRRSQAVGDEVTKIEISGIDDSDEKQLIDLLDYRVEEVIEVEPDSDRRVSFKTRRNALLQAFAKRKDELRGLLSGEEPHRGSNT